MKKNNRLVALLMAAALMVTAAACDSFPASSNPTPPSESFSASSSVPASSTPEVLTAPDKEYVKGVTTDGEYVSEFWGIKFACPDESITLATEEQISTLIGFGTDALESDPARAEQLQAQLELYEMAAIDMGTGSMLMMMCIELPVAGVSGEIYVKSILEGLKMPGSNLTIELDNEGGSFKETVGGKEFTCVSYIMKAGENIPESHQTQRILVDGKRALLVSTTYTPAIATGKDKEAAMLAAITPIE